MMGGPKYMLGIRIPVRLDPDLFKQIWILERNMEVRAMNIEARSPCCGKIRHTWEPLFYIYGYATLWTVALKRPNFKRKNVLAKKLRSRDTVPLNS
jgi:hypothetical protein